MKFRKFKVNIIAGGSQYGFECTFENGLNIIRGDNSSGKSTLVNSLIYSIGMEEIIGSKGNNSLPYALKTYFELNDEKIDILESMTLVEVENRYGEIKTFKRAITSESKDTKLVEIINGDYLTKLENSSFTTSYAFVHDPGSAQDKELGFYAYLEDFIDLELPIVSNNSGSDTKLYLQTIFSSLFIEQKRGWTNYIANTPYYPISSLREKIVSFLLDLDKFRNQKKLDQLISERNTIITNWAEGVTNIKLLLKANSLTINGLSSKPVLDFRRELVDIGEGAGTERKSLSLLLSGLVNKLNDYEQKEQERLSELKPDTVEKIEAVRNEISELMLVHKMCGDGIRINQAKQKQYKQTLENILKDLKKNKLTKKVNDFGAEFELKVAKGECAVCLNLIDDNLAPPENISMPMSIDENIRHLENQKIMIESLLNGLEKEISTEKASLTKISRELTERKSELVSYKKDMRSLSLVNESDVRVKVNLENRYKDLSEVSEQIENLLSKHLLLSKEYAKCQSSINDLSKFSVSYQDNQKITIFEQLFRGLASRFGYRSAKVEEISINENTLIPYLQGLELREYSTDIKSDSSASDFVRLIWAYLISIYKVSDQNKGNHPGILLFDEPAQHSMGLDSVNQMLKELSTTAGLQSIVAASFDQSDATFEESTTGVDFHLVRLPRKLINKR